MDAPPGPTIGIDARAAAEVPGGRGRVVRELLRALAAREDDGRSFLLYARTRWDGAELPAERFGWRLSGAPDLLWHPRSALAANRECDVFLATNSYLTGVFLRIPNVPIVHDLTTFEPAMRPNRRSVIVERATLGIAARRASRLVAVSQATRRELVERFPVAAAKTVVAQLGVTPGLFAEPSPAELSGLPQAGFVLAVGTLEPRKNLPRLVAAYGRLDGGTRARHPLVVVGAAGWQTGETLQALRSLGRDCTMLGHVSDAALGELYRRCEVFCYPSLGEGFGLPVLEAMALGAAVVTSNLSSLPEVGGEAVQYVDPSSVESIHAGLKRVLEDTRLREELSERAAVRAKGFSWERFGQTVLDTLEQAAAQAPHRRDGSSPPPLED